MTEPDIFTFKTDIMQLFTTQAAVIYHNSSLYLTFGKS